MRRPGMSVSGTATLLGQAVQDVRTGRFERSLSATDRRRCGEQAFARPGPAVTLVAAVAHAMTQGLRARDLARSIHAYPTCADGVWNTALAGGPGRPAAPRPATGHEAAGPLSSAEVSH